MCVCGQEHSSAVQSALPFPQGISCQNSLFKFTEETHKGLCYIFFAGGHMKSSTIPPLKIVFPALWVEEEGLFFLFNLHLDVNLHISKEKPVSLCGL